MKLLMAAGALACILATSAHAQVINDIHTQSTVTLPVAVGDEIFIWDPTATPPAGQYKATVQQLYNIAGVAGDCSGSGGPVVTIVCAMAASKITSGTFPAARLPFPTVSTIGGVESLTPPAHQWLQTISTAGVVTAAQPSAADLSDGVTNMTGNEVGNAMRNGTAPTSVTACGTSPSVGVGSTDYSGTINVGSGTVTACTITFAVTHTPALRCQIEPSSGTPVATSTTMSTTTMIVGFASSLGAGKFDYACH